MSKGREPVSDGVAERLAALGLSGAQTAGAQRLEGNERARMIGAHIHEGVISSDYYEVAVETKAKPV